MNAQSIIVYVGETILHTLLRCVNIMTEICRLTDPMNVEQLSAF